MNAPVTDIIPNRPWWHLEWREIWERRYLLRLLIRKDLLASYKQSLLGPAWFVIQPVVSALLFAVVFGRLVGLSATGVPRFLFFLAATVPWTFFQALTLGVAGSLNANLNVLGKVYFPRLIVPLAAAGVAMVHFLVNYGVLIMFYILHSVRTDTPMLFSVRFVPLVVLLLVMVLTLGIGTGLWCAAAGIRYRDIRISLPVILQTWMFATPIIYPSTIVPPAWRTVFFLNPMAGIVETHRHLYLGTHLPAPGEIALGIPTALFILISGLFVFHRNQRTFIDIA